MTQADDDGAAVEPTPVEEVERRLGLAPEDRRLHHGLHHMNTRDNPRVRLTGYVIALAVAPVHNAVVLGGVDWTAMAILAAGVLAYAFGSWAVLRGWFHRIEKVHLGFVFVYLDLLVFTWLIHATGGPRSLYWPIYLVRVADQMWLERERAWRMAGLGAALYAGLVAAWWAAGLPVDPAREGVKLVVLGGIGLVLALAARGPWEVDRRAVEARDLIVRLEEQSVELDEQRRRAQAANRSKSEFLARMSHELRTPLNSVVGFTNVLLKRRGRELGEREMDYLDRIRQNGLHLLALINDILDLSKIEQGRMNIELSEVDLAALVHDTVHQLADRAVNGPVDLRVRVPAGLAPIRADEARLRQVLINLVGNALKFTDEGTVEVRVIASEGDVPERIEVGDTGIGIGADRLDRIFEVFEQAEGGSSRRHGGTGLGLAISRALCALMDFHLTVVSEPGVGSTFTVWFEDPKRRGAVDPAAGAPESVASHP